MKFKTLKKIITSTLIIGVIISSSSNVAFAKEHIKENKSENSKILQQQNDAFDQYDRQIKKNRATLVNHDKDSNGKERSGTYPTRKGVILVTRDGSFDKLVGHAGIIYNSTTTVESFPKSSSSKNIDGVTTYSNTWNSRYTTVYAVTTSGTTTTQDAAAANIAYSYINKSYNWIFSDINTTNKFYCSQLVYRSYLDATKKNLNQGGGIVFPIDLVQSSNTYTIYTKGV